jgi:hypothetical protein
MAVSKRLRYEVLRRDNYRCRYCGIAAPDAKLTVDHVLPGTLGGTDEPGNLVSACADCNGGKSASTPDAALVAEVDEKAIRWSQAMQLAIERRTADLAENRAALHRFDQHWRSHTDSDDGCVRLVHRDGSWRGSVTQFMSNGLDVESILEALDTAMDAPKIPDGSRWRYFCGICWRQIEELRKVASAMVEAVDIGDGQPAPSSPGAGGEAGDRHPIVPQPASFDYMTMFEVFLEDLIPALGGDDEVAKFVNWDLWSSMPDAHKVWRETLRNPRESDEEERAEVAAQDASREQMSMSIAYGMHQVRLWRESRDRSLGRAVDGSNVGGS